MDISELILSKIPIWRDKLLLGDVEIIELQEGNIPRIIRSDVERTRSFTITLDDRVVLERILYGYTIHAGIPYKQGMNELGVPFLLFVRYGMHINEAFTMFVRFMEKYLSFIFLDIVYFI